jgi:hypothetical protein
MAHSARKTFKVKSSGEAAGNEQELRRQAMAIVTGKNERAFRGLVELQGRELKLLESERTWVEKEKARDIAVINDKEIAAINLRYDRREHELQRKHNSFLGKVHRVFGGHKKQQRQMNALTAERNRVVTERTEQHVRREAQRQRSLTERHLRVEKDLQETKDRQSRDRDQFRQQREQSFEVSVASEIHRLRVQPKVGM